MDLFFERMKTERDEWPEVLRVDIFPEEVRWQCWHIWTRSFNSTKEQAKSIIDAMAQHIGVKYLVTGIDEEYRRYSSELEEFFTGGLDKASEIDNINYAFSVLELMCQQMRYNKDSVDEINKRLRLGGIGYKFINDKLFPVQGVL